MYSTTAQQNHEHRLLRSLGRWLTSGDFMLNQINVVQNRTLILLQPWLRLVWGRSPTGRINLVFALGLGTPDACFQAVFYEVCRCLQPYRFCDQKNSTLSTPQFAPSHLLSIHRSCTYLPHSPELCSNYSISAPSLPLPSSFNKHYYVNQICITQLLWIRSLQPVLKTNSELH